MRPMKHSTVCRRLYAMIFVDDFTSITWIRILRSKSDTTAGLESFTLNVATPVDTLRSTPLGLARENSLRGHSKNFSTSLLSRTRSPFPAPRSTMVRRGEGWVLKEKTIIQTEGVEKRKNENLWAKAMSFSANMCNRCISTTKKGNIPHVCDKWPGTTEKSTTSRRSTRWGSCTR